ncbi:MAG TPA: hypothetical protein VJG83_03560 [archaeon]|nr:hypothetical protein [archaeon]
MHGRIAQSGSSLSTGDLRVYIYDANVSGNLVYDSGSDFNNAINDGVVDVVLGSSTQLDLNYGGYYYIDLSINGTDLDFNGSERKQFESSHGVVKTGSILDATITNSDISTTAGIDWAKISKTGADLNALKWGSDFNSQYSRKTADDNVTGAWNFANNTTFSGGFGLGGITIQNGVLYTQSLVILNDLNAATVTAIDVNGNYTPFLDVTWSLGSSSNRWLGIFTRDLNATDVNSTRASIGTLGIGTNSPSARFQVLGSSGDTNILSVNRSTGAPGLVVLSDGNVGIGTTTPTALLSLAGQQNWVTGLGSITHIIGPTDATFAINGGTGSSTGMGVTISGGTSPGGGAAGDVTIQGGSSPNINNSTTGSVIIKTQNAVGTQNVGTITIQTGTGLGDAPGPDITVTAGNASTSGNVNQLTGGSILLTTGNGQIGHSSLTTAGSAGTFTLTGGVGGRTTGTSAVTYTNGTGGAFTFTGGAGGASSAAGSGSNVAGTGGAFTITAGAGGSPSGATSGTNNGGTGGGITLSAGAGGSPTAGTTIVSGNGGDVNISAGTGGTTGTAGVGGVISFKTGALDTLSERFRITNAGLVGIRDTTPDALLDVNGINLNQDVFRVDANGNENPSTFIIDKNGNIGIGNSSPTQKIDINGNLRIVDGAVGNIYIGQATDSTGYNLISLNSDTTTAAEGIFGQSAGDNTMYVQGRGNLRLRGRSDASSYINMALTNITTTLGGGGNFNITGGNVGTGTSTPQNTLNVVGDLNVATSATATPSLYVNSTDGNTGINTTTPSARLNVFAGSGDTNILSVNRSTGAPGLVILNDGNVGIGTAAPSRLLQVSGTGLFNKVDIGTTTGSGFLFDVQTAQSENTGRFKSSTHVEVVLDATSGNQKVLRFSEAGTLRWQLGMDNSPSGITSDFSISQSNNPTTPEFIIKTSGNVGIATSTPQNTLNVIGDINATTGYKINNASGLTATISVRKGDDSGACTIDVNGGIITQTTC